MKLNSIVVGSILLISSLIIGWLFINNQEIETNSVLDESASVTPTPNRFSGDVSEGVRSSLRDQLLIGDTKTCEFTHVPEASNTTEGDLLTLNDQFYISLTTTDASATVVTNVLFGDEIMHLWGDTYGGEPYALTFPITKVSIVDNNELIALSQGAVSVFNEYLFRCETGTVDESQFIPPSNINFFDPTAMFAPPN